jgi:hypothetical protein
VLLGLTVELLLPTVEPIHGLHAPGVPILRYEVDLLPRVSGRPATSNLPGVAVVKAAMLDLSIFGTLDDAGHEVALAVDGIDGVNHGISW